MQQDQKQLKKQMNEEQNAINDKIRDLRVSNLVTEFRKDLISCNERMQTTRDGKVFSSLDRLATNSVVSLVSQVCAEHFGFEKLEEVLTIVLNEIREINHRRRKSVEHQSPTMDDYHEYAMKVLNEPDTEEDCHLAY